jgi:hypothetical protein
MRIDRTPTRAPTVDATPVSPKVASTVDNTHSDDVRVPVASSNPTAAVLPSASSPWLTSSMTPLAARTATVQPRAWAWPEVQPIPAALAVHSNGAALAAKLRPLTRHDVVTLHYDTAVFAEQLLAHLQTQAHMDPVAAFRTFTASAQDAVHDVGGSNCVGLCSDLVTRLRAQGTPAFVVPVEHPVGVRCAHEPPFGHVAAVVPFVDDSGVRGLVLLDTGANLSEPVPLVPGASVDVPLGTSGRSMCYQMALDGKTVACTRLSSSGVAIDVTTLHVVEVQNPDAQLTRPYASMNPVATLCARDADGSVIASLVLDFEKASVRASVLGQKVGFALTDSASLDATITPAFAGMLGTTREVLLARVRSLVDGAGLLNALRTALEGGAA